MSRYGPQTDHSRSSADHPIICDQISPAACTGPTVNLGQDRAGVTSSRLLRADEIAHLHTAMARPWPSEAISEH
jgi:hypothetical protein